MRGAVRRAPQGLEPQRLDVRALRPLLCRLAHHHRVAVERLAERPRRARLLRLPGINMARTIQAICSVFPLAADVECPIAYMQVSGTEPPYRTALQREVMEVLAPNLRLGQTAEAIERFAFYERARQAYAVLVTGELQPFGNFILRKGVIDEALRP